MSNGAPIYPPIEIEFLKLLKELQPIVVKALNSLGGKNHPMLVLSIWALSLKL
jgi:hypothetical protein